MDQVKIGRFISECRKKQNLTQSQLAEKLNITDRAVSKWETGRAMPDSSLMLDLCSILKISVNDLLNARLDTVEDSVDLLDDKIKALANSVQRIKYEISSTPKGALVDYRDKEIRVLCPRNTEWVKQKQKS